MRDPDLFDTFYKEARDRLLLQTYALTGDLAASRAAVRDAFLVAWHHWRKVSALDDPETSVRPHAWQYAQRRATTRPWHRERGVPDDVRATLEALGKLPAGQRKALLLTQLAAVTPAQMAREVGLPLEDAERELQQATTQYSLLRDVPGSEVRSTLEPLGAVVADVRWPRATIVRRAGATRRRTHTAVGAAVAVAALLGSGAVVTDVAGVRPSLEGTTTAAVPQPDEPAGAEPPREVSLTSDALLAQSQLREATGRGTWTTTSTSTNDEGNGLVVPCQQERYADPSGMAAQVRTFTSAAGQGGRVAVDAVQAAELSRSETAARRAFTTALGWYAGCVEPQTQLLGMSRAAGLGDQAMLVALRAWGEPTATTVVGVARTGALLTTTALTTENGERPDLRAAAQLLGGAVSQLCTLPEGGACVADEELRDAPVLPVGPAPALLTELDLPPLDGLDLPWVGTEPRPARTNAAATRCDSASFAGRFQGARFADTTTRTFVVPEADLTAEFGLTETAGTLPARQAQAFVEDVRSRVAGCEEDDQGLGTQVEQVLTRDRGEESLTVWDITVDVSDERSVRFTMAVMRRGSALAQLTFVPAPRVEMGREAFLALTDRALDRLGELPRRPNR